MGYKAQLGDTPSGKWKRMVKRLYNKWLRSRAKENPDQPIRREYKGYD